ncbi:MAG: shikimate dehydrogenase [Oscillospiraceae bacterium]|nr:shikimate dehydrogenase [Oscillospiraceae bacterium]
MEYGLIGEHLGHSYSAEIHRLLRGYAYQLCPIAPAELPAFFARRDFRGINVTIPYKKDVLPYCDALGETARRVGSVNTILRGADGKLFGDNTDLAGFGYMLRRAGISLAGKQVLVLGSGGASLTAQLAAADAAAASVTVVSRAGATNYENAAQRCPGTQVILNATPVGMFPHAQHCPIDPALFPRAEAAVDMIYNPLRSRLLQKAAALGLRCTDGLAMLVAQAEEAATLFTGQRAAPGAVERVLRQLRGSTENWVLIGMPGCGKSTIGAALAKAAGRPFVDTDDLAAVQAGVPLPEYFATHGEAAFRELEARVIREIGVKTGLVIATGGGAVLRAENAVALRQNGRVLWLRRPVERLARSGRPLSSGLAELRAMEAHRLPFYERAADMQLQHNEDWDAVQEAALRLFQKEN